MTNIKDISYLFNLPFSRKNCLEVKILPYYPEFWKDKFKDVCKTGLGWKKAGHGHFWGAFCSNVLLLVMKENSGTVLCNSETLFKEESFFKLVDAFEFIVTLVVPLSTLNYLLPVTNKLQAYDFDVAQWKELIQSLKLPVDNLRNSGEKYHYNWCNKAEKTSRKIWHSRN